MDSEDLTKRFGMMDYKFMHHSDVDNSEYQQNYFETPYSVSRNYVPNSAGSDIYTPQSDIATPSSSESGFFDLYSSSSSSRSSKRKWDSREDPLRKYGGNVADCTIDEETPKLKKSRFVRGFANHSKKNIFPELCETTSLLQPIGNRMSFDLEPHTKNFKNLKLKVTPSKFDSVLVASTPLSAGYVSTLQAIDEEVVCDVNKKRSLLCEEVFDSPSKRIKIEKTEQLTLPTNDLRGVINRELLVSVTPKKKSQVEKKSLSSQKKIKILTVKKDLIEMDSPEKENSPMTKFIEKSEKMRIVINKQMHVRNFHDFIIFEEVERKIDFLHDLTHKSKCPHLVRHIFSYLSPMDLYHVGLVSTGWKNMVLDDSSSREKYNGFIITRNLSKENSCYPLTQDALEVGKYEDDTPRKAFSAKQEYTPKRTGTPSVPPISPGKRKFYSYLEEGRKLEKGAILLPCPICRRPARVNRKEETGACVNITCGYMFCTRCQSKVHANKVCDFYMPVPTPSPEKVTKKTTIGSKQSKRALRRL